jgi:hypothetical protein
MFSACYKFIERTLQANHMLCGPIESLDHFAAPLLFASVFYFLSHIYHGSMGNIPQNNI